MLLHLNHPLDRLPSQLLQPMTMTQARQYAIGWQ
jgi:hypothetical protein